MLHTATLLGLTADRAYLWKPAGLPVFPPHDGVGTSLYAWWQAHPDFPAEGFPAGFEGGIAHRLDTATSGLVLVARNAGSLTALRERFASRALRKLYVFRSQVAPSVAGYSSTLIEVPIAHHPRSSRRMIVQDRPVKDHRGRWYPAWTRFTALEQPAATSENEGFLWQAEIRTGVMHQIRVHALHAGIPLCGDPLYGAGSEGPFLLHHAQMIFPEGASPVAPLGDGTEPRLVL